jgi:hypothetical protein
MATRAPLDIDLEDKLLYGLTPMRLAYVAVALAVGFAAWSSHWAPGGLRACAASVVIALGAFAGWGRWRGRAIDGWVADLVLFVFANYSLNVDPAWKVARTWPWS